MTASAVGTFSFLITFGGDGRGGRDLLGLLLWDRDVLIPLLWFSFMAD